MIFSEAPKTIEEWQRVYGGAIDKVGSSSWNQLKHENKRKASLEYQQNVKDLRELVKSTSQNKLQKASLQYKATMIKHKKEEERATLRAFHLKKIKEVDDAEKAELAPIVNEEANITAAMESDKEEQARLEDVIGAEDVQRKLTSIVMTYHGKANKNNVGILMYANASLDEVRSDIQVPSVHAINSMTDF